MMEEKARRERKGFIYNRPSLGPTTFDPPLEPVKSAPGKAS
jgi:hypothetical protein